MQKRSLHKTITSISKQEKYVKAPVKVEKL